MQPTEIPKNSVKVRPNVPSKPMLPNDFMTAQNLDRSIDTTRHQSFIETFSFPHEHKMERFNAEHTLNTTLMSLSTSIHSSQKGAYEGSEIILSAEDSPDISAREGFVNLHEMSKSLPVENVYSSNAVKKSLKTLNHKSWHEKYHDSNIYGKLFQNTSRYCELLHPLLCTKLRSILHFGQHYKLQTWLQSFRNKLISPFLRLKVSLRYAIIFRSLFSNVNSFFVQFRFYQLNQALIVLNISEKTNLASQYSDWSITMPDIGTTHVPLVLRILTFHIPDSPISVTDLWRAMNLLLIDRTQCLAQPTTRVTFLN